MSFNTMKVAELREVAEMFGVDVSEDKNKQAILATLSEEGITYETYAAFVGAEKIDVESEEYDGPAIPSGKTKVVASDDVVLVKMERGNPHYETQGYTFTSDHPFVAVPADDAQKIFDAEEWGFRMATPKEVQEYYS